MEILKPSVACTPFGCASWCTWLLQGVKISISTFLSVDNLYYYRHHYCFVGLFSLWISLRCSSLEINPQSINLFIINTCTTTNSKWIVLIILVDILVSIAILFNVYMTLRKTLTFTWSYFTVLSIPASIFCFKVVDLGYHKIFPSFNLF